jgi:hypothetical protein
MYLSIGLAKKENYEHYPQITIYFLLVILSHVSLCHKWTHILQDYSFPLNLPAISDTHLMLKALPCKEHKTT